MVVAVQNKTGSKIDPLKKKTDPDPQHLGQGSIKVSDLAPKTLEIDAEKAYGRSQSSHSSHHLGHGSCIRWLLRICCARMK